MAKQLGPIYACGTVFGITYYKMGGKYYARTKTSLNKQRLLRDPAFARFLQCSGLFKTASKMATELYRQIPKESRYHNQRQKMTGSAFRMLRKGRKLEKVMMILYRRHVAKWMMFENPEAEGSINSTSDNRLSRSLKMMQGLFKKYLILFEKIKPHSDLLVGANDYLEEELFLAG